MLQVNLNTTEILKKLLQVNLKHRDFTIFKSYVYVHETHAEKSTVSFESQESKSNLNSTDLHCQPDWWCKTSV